MINNDILRRIRYAFDISDPKMIEIFKLADVEVTREELTVFLSKEDDEGFVECRDKYLAAFLDGFIIKNRGKQEPKPGQKPRKAESLNNNLILKKLRIAMTLQEDGMLGIFKLAGFDVTKSELSAFFRRKGHKHYKDCGDQFLRNFLKGLTIRYRDMEDK